MLQHSYPSIVPVVNCDVCVFVPWYFFMTFLHHKMPQPWDEVKVSVSNCFTTQPPHIYFLFPPYSLLHGILIFGCRDIVYDIWRLEMSKEEVVINSQLMFYAQLNQQSSSFLVFLSHPMISTVGSLYCHVAPLSYKANVTLYYYCW